MAQYDSYIRIPKHKIEKAKFNIFNKTSKFFDECYENIFTTVHQLANENDIF